MFIGSANSSNDNQGIPNKKQKYRYNIYYFYN